MTEPTGSLRAARNEGSQFTTAEHARYVIRDDCPPTVHARRNVISQRWESPVEERK